MQLFARLSNVARTPSPSTCALPRRLAAICYDALLLGALLLVLTAAVLAARDGTAIPPGTWWFRVVLVGTWVLFFSGFWRYGGQTLGMRAWKIRVVRDDGAPLLWSDALLRFGAAWLSSLPAGLGFWWSLADSERRCWHDRLSRTHLRFEPQGPGDLARPSGRQAAT
jgi:uncharacterized RDD family membrane protein YckC